MPPQILGGAVVAQGELDAIVHTTGGDTFFGKTLALLAQPQERGHLQQVRARALAESAAACHDLCLKPKDTEKPEALTVGTPPAAQVLSRVSVALGLLAFVGVVVIFLVVLVAHGEGAEYSIVTSFVIFVR